VRDRNSALGIVSIPECGVDREGEMKFGGGGDGNGGEEEVRSEK
jgi:hypothetical protein